MAHFIEFDGNQQIPPPSKMLGLQGHLLTVFADFSKLVAECDKFLNIDPSGRFTYRPLGPFVLMQSLFYPYNASLVPQFFAQGFSSQNEFAISIPVVKWLGSIPVELAVYVPYTFVDDGWSVVAAQTEFGYAKALGRFRKWQGPDESFFLSVETEVLPTYSPQTRLTFERFLTIKDIALDVNPVTYKPEEMGPCGPLFTAVNHWGADPDIEWWQYLLVFLLVAGAFTTQSVNSVQMVQFRDPVNINNAVYQALLGSKLTFHLNDLSVQLGTPTVEIIDYDSLPIVDRLGLNLNLLLPMFRMNYNMMLSDVNHIYVAP